MENGWWLPVVENMCHALSETKFIEGIKSNTEIYSFLKKFADKKKEEANIAKIILDLFYERGAFGSLDSLDLWELAVGRSTVEGRVPKA